MLASAEMVQGESTAGKGRRSRVKDVCNINGANQPLCLLREVIYTYTGQAEV